MAQAAANACRPPGAPSEELQQLLGLLHVLLHGLLDALQANLAPGLLHALPGDGEGDVVLELVLGLDHEALQPLRARSRGLVHEVVHRVRCRAEVRDAEPADHGLEVRLRVLLQGRERLLGLGLQRQDLGLGVHGLLGLGVAHDHRFLRVHLEGAPRLPEAGKLGRTGRRQRRGGGKCRPGQRRAPRGPRGLGGRRHEGIGGGGGPPGREAAGGEESPGQLAARCPRRGLRGHGLRHAAAAGLGLTKELEGTAASVGA
mmetsp:Transcript_29093/g.90687  ORF Transcript_29093/g.90687 Transcript_29093/m.90687 type:complete len:258 (+) Transcript_29093:86-859(+)